MGTDPAHDGQDQPSSDPISESAAGRSAAQERLRTGAGQLGKGLGRAGRGAEAGLRRTLENRAARRAEATSPIRPPMSHEVELRRVADMAHPAAPHVVPSRVPDGGRGAAAVRHMGQPRTRQNTTNPAAIVALIAAIVFPPAGLPLARMARKECRADGRPGEGIALTASLVASFLTGVMVLTTLLLFWGLVSGVNQLADALGAVAGFLKIVTNLLS